MKPPARSLVFLQEPAPRSLPNRETLVYLTRSHRYLLTIALGFFGSLWLLFVCFKSPRPGQSFADVVWISTLVWGFFAVLFGVPAWWYGRSKVRSIEHLLRHGELATGTAHLRPQKRNRRPRVLVAVRKSSGPIVSSFQRFGADLRELRAGDSVEVLLAADCKSGDVAALVTATEFCVGSVVSTARGPERSTEPKDESRGMLEPPPDGDA